jgi:phosphoglycolate phosphatase-like HAD superfamily hydrolase
LLEPFLETLQEDGCALGIISKSTKNTIQKALQDAGLERFFTAPLVDKAVGFEGKAGFLEELVSESQYTSFPADNIHQVMLVDDDLRELARASAKGAQTFPAPSEGGLQKVDLVELLTLALGNPAPLAAAAAAA